MATIKFASSIMPFSLLLGEYDECVVVYEHLFNLRLNFVLSTMYIEQKIFADSSKLFENMLIQKPMIGENVK